MPTVWVRLEFLMWCPRSKLVADNAPDIFMGTVYGKNYSLHLPLHTR